MLLALFAEVEQGLRPEASLWAEAFPVGLAEQHAKRDRIRKGEITLIKP